MWSWSAQKAVNPLVMAKAEGIYFWDANGKRYTDFNSQLMCSNIGHQHPKVLQAIKDQCDELAFAGPSVATRVRAELGPLLASHTPGNLNKFFFTLGGAEANENALKFAKLYTKRHKIITRYRSYHGATHATMIMTGDARRFPNELGNAMGGVIRVFDPYMYRSHLYRAGMSEEEFSDVCLRQLEETIIFENPNSIAAMFIETVTGTNGIIPPPRGYLPGLRKLLSKYGIMMVCDEVMCGLGRTGAWFACDNWSVVPDIITMAKGVTSAYLPLGVVAVSEDIAKYFDDVVYNGGLTYNGHPLCLSAAVANLKVMEEEKIVDNAKKMGEVMARHHQEMLQKHVCVGDVRSIGLFGCLELVKDRKTKEPLSPFNGTSAVVGKMMAFLREKGLSTFTAQNAYPQGTIFMTNPPLTINEQQIDEAFKTIDEALTIVDTAIKDGSA